MKWNHRECMVPRSFIWLPEMVVSQDPTPAARPSGWTLKMIRRALFEHSELARPPVLCVHLM